MKKLKVGDIFYLSRKSSNQYIVGRILFDVDEQFHKIVDRDGFSSDYFPYLAMSHDGCKLVEIYRGLYDSVPFDDVLFKDPAILIPNVFVKGIDSKNIPVEWGTIGFKDVDYKSINFPEQLNLVNDIIHLDRGELSIKTRLSQNQAEELGYRTSLFVPAVICDAALDFQGKRELIRENVRWPVYIKDADLAYDQDLRRRLYRELNIDPDKSYYELSKEMGYDLSRFY